MFANKNSINISAKAIGADGGLKRQPAPLFVFSIDGLKQNAGSLLTPVSYTVCYALSYGTLGFALHGSSFNHILIGGNSSTANQIH